MLLGVSLRALLPSWRFFDRPTPSPQLLVQRGDAWVQLGPPPRRWYSWAFAPAHNLWLAQHALVEQLIAAIADIDARIPDDDPRITGLPAYALVANVARAHGATRWRIQVSADETFDGSIAGDGSP